MQNVKYGLIKILTNERPLPCLYIADVSQVLVLQEHIFPTRATSYTETKTHDRFYFYITALMKHEYVPLYTLYVHISYFTLTPQTRHIPL